MTPDDKNYQLVVYVTLSSSLCERAFPVEQAGLRHLPRCGRPFRSVIHYLKERNHQGLANRIITPEPCCDNKTGAVERRQRLGGRLNYYYRAAA